MFFGLNNIFKKILPTRLFYRSLIIVAAPLIILQIIITVVFFDSIWIKANKGLTRSLVGELKTLSDIYTGEDPKQIEYLTEQFKLNFEYVINIKDEKLPNISREARKRVDYVYSLAKGIGILNAYSDINTNFI